MNKLQTIIFVIAGLSIFPLGWYLITGFTIDPDLDDAHEFEDSQYKLGRIINTRYNDESVDPYQRIEALEDEVVGYLREIEKLREIIYSLRKNPSAEPQNEGSHLGAFRAPEGLDDSTSSKDSGECS